MTRPVAMALSDDDYCVASYDSPCYVSCDLATKFCFSERCNV